jgi:hypothetical protein
LHNRPVAGTLRSVADPAAGRRAYIPTSSNCREDGAQPLLHCPAHSQMREDVKLLFSDCIDDFRSDQGRVDSGLYACRYLSEKCRCRASRLN